MTVFLRGIKPEPMIVYINASVLLLTTPNTRSRQEKKRCLNAHPEKLRSYQTQYSFMSILSRFVLIVHLPVFRRPYRFQGTNMKADHSRGKFVLILDLFLLAFFLLVF